MTLYSSSPFIKVIGGYRRQLGTAEKTIKHYNERAVAFPTSHFVVATEEMSSFSEAIQPILKFLQFCGLDFQLRDDGRRNYFLRIYAAVCLSLNIGWNSYTYVKFFPNLTLSTINDFVDSFNFVFGNIAIHTAMYLMTFGSFQEICHAIQRLERLLEHDAEYFHKLRHSSWIAVTFIFSFV